MNSFRAIRFTHFPVAAAFIAALIFLFAGVWSAAAAPIITATKDDNLAAGLRKLPGNTITYTTTIANTGDATATAVQFADPDPANTTFVSVNSTPLARADTYSAIGNVQITIAAGSGVLVNDSDADDSVNGAGALTASAAATSANGGNVSMSANGGFTYNSAPGFTGADTFTYTLTDTEGSTDTGTVTINVTGTIWFINAAAGAGDGRLTSPFNSIASYTGSAPAKDPGDNIFLYTGSYTGLTLLANQRLIGQGASTSLQAITGLTPPAGSLAYPATGGTRPTIAVSAGTAVTLGAGNTVNGLNVTNSNGSGIAGSAVGTLTLADFDVTVTGGSALSLTTSGTVTATGADNDLVATTGVGLNMNGVAIGAAGMTFKRVTASGSTNGIALLNGGTGFFTITGTGTTDGSGGVIQNTSNRGASFISTGAVSLSNMTFTNVGTTELVNSDTGGGGISLGEDASFNLNTNAGIHLVNITGVTLTNIDMSGGAQQGINGNNVTNFVLTNSNITGFGNQVREDGIHFKDMLGTSSITNTNLGGNTAATNNAAVQIHIENYTGTLGTNVTINNVNVQSRGFAASGVTWSHGLLFVLHNAANADLIVSNNIFNNLFSNSIHADSDSTGVFEETINNNTFTNVGASGITSALDSNGTMRVYIHDNGTAGVPTFLRGANTGASHSININHAGNAGTASLLQATVSNNFIGDNSSSSSASSGGAGIRVFSVSSGTATVKLNDNNIKGVLEGILVSMGEDVNPAHTLNATIFNNTVSVTNGPNGFEGIFVNAGTSSTNSGAGPDQGIMRLDLHDNTSGSSASAGNTDFAVRQRFLTTVQLLNYAGANNNNAAVETYLDVTRNNTPNGINGDWFITNSTALAPPQGPGGGFVNTASVPQPTLPLPLMFAAGGVEAKARVAANVRGTDLASANDASPRPNVSDSGTPALPAGIVRALTQAELDSLVAAALARWTATGLTGAQLATLRRLQFEVADLPGWYLGEAGGDRIRVDNDAGGNGWFIGAAAEDDALFLPNEAISTTRRYTDPAGAPAGRIDLLTALLHEMGHALGLDDTYAEQDRDSLMYGFLTKGERRLPAKDQAAGATPHAEAHPHFLGVPLTIGDLPAGKTVTITYVVTINAGTTAISTSSQGTVSGSNIANKVTNDPQTGAADDATVTPIHQPPVVSNVAASTNEDTTLVFAAGNFTPGSYSDPNGDPIASVIVTSLPANGVLKNGVATITITPTVIAIANIGNLSYVPNLNYNGPDSFGWNASDGTLVAVSAATVNLTINAVNDVPSFTKGADQTVLEDAVAQSVAGWATALSVGPANEAGQVLNFIVGNNNPGLFTLQPAIAANGTLTFTPAANANGTATVTVQIHDNGGVLNGGVDTSAPQTFLITVTAVNDVPGFIKGPDMTVNEDAGPQTVPGWATAISAGPTDEAGQVLNFIVNNSNNPLFSVQPAVAANGTLTYTPAANASGSAVVSVQIHDSGGVLNGGSDTSAVQSFLITVNSVNDVPSFTKGPDQTVNEDALAQTVPGWATALSVGPANEVGQVLNFIVGNNNPSLFSLQPAVSATGTLTYTPAANANGTATVTVQIRDNGGIANGGVDTSAPQSFIINVTAVNDPPVINAQVPIALAQGHSRTIVFTDVTVMDPDNTYPTGFTLTVQNGANYARVANTITPTPGFVGMLSVPVQVNDGTANSNVFNLVITVNPNAEQVATNATIVPEPGGGFRVSFLGAPGATYTIQYTNSLATVAIVWQPLGTVAAAANGRYSMVDIPPANTPMRYYRSTEPYMNDFGNGLGPVTLRGTAVLTNSAMKLTDEVTGGSGAVVFEGLLAGPTLNGFTARFNLALGPGTAPPADGASFAVGNLGATVWGETGPATPNSLAVGFDTFANGPANESIGIHIWVNGAHLAVNATNPYTNGATVPVEIIYDTLNGLTVRYNSVLIFTNLAIPGFTFPAAGGGFGIGARTGGSLERAVVDDVEITPR